MRQWWIFLFISYCFVAVSSLGLIGNFWQYCIHLRKNRSCCIGKRIRNSDIRKKSLFIPEHQYFQLMWYAIFTYRRATKTKTTHREMKKRMIIIMSMCRILLAARKHPGSTILKHGFVSQLCHPLHVWSWTNYSNLLCKMECTVVSNSQDCIEDYDIINKCKMLIKVHPT